MSYVKQPHRSSAARQDLVPTAHCRIVEREHVGTGQRPHHLLTGTDSCRDGVAAAMSTDFGRNFGIALLCHDPTLLGGCYGIAVSRESSVSCVSLWGMSAGSVAIVTCVSLPEPDPDQDLLLAALATAGVDAHLVPWDDPDVRWADFQLAVLRSTWNYIQDLPAFLAWIQHTSKLTQLLNPAEVVLANSHKHYLIELANRGLPVVPTSYWPKGADVSLAAVMAEQGWDDVVVKPAVGAGSYLTERFDVATAAAGQQFWSRAIAEREMLVQPYLPSVAEYGERCLIWIAGEFTHAVRKNPRLGDAEESVSDALTMSSDELRVAEQALAAVAHELLYGRVDLIRDSADEPLIAEIELIEPSLFLQQSPAALARLVAAISARS